MSLSLSIAAFFAFKDTDLCLLPSAAFTPGSAALALTQRHLLGLASCSAPQKPHVFGSETHHDSISYLLANFPLKFRVVSLVKENLLIQTNTPLPSEMI